MSGRKVLITGSNGMLGSSLTKLLPYKLIALNSQELDITDSNKCFDVIEREKPNIIIHTAAYTDVEGCELDADKAYKINTIGTQNLVNCCIDKDILFIYISSTGIYGESKEKELYNEFDKVNPTTIHHKSKYEAEKIVERHLSRYLVLRTGWLFGGDVEHRKNFVYKRYLEAKNTKEMYSDESQIGNPTYVNDLVDQIKVLIEENQYGLFNCVNKAEGVSRFHYVSKIIDSFKLTCDVKRASSKDFKRVAKVSKNESAQNYKLELLKLNVMSDWDNSLEKYIAALEKKID
ncbi:NAD(P)-dependent oxidoreductase [Ferrimonas sp. YFM]|uniref:SDR family oxidoreductase n=1 Tax=Ferrimonas sp. YFM TaxID=3028878 RepID=UPI0025737015|nr:NAD(P)-dependent oxidoreductase [Ferrimonas sp. YFM]BDY04070.1 NAD(P)-dependent oxidoreductase [Ferrimonas sp. YFM]